jgi:probable DNA repair protein
MGSPIPATILTALSQGKTILTANQRAARVLRRAYDLAQHAAGIRLWTPPEIFALDTWLPYLWHTLLVAGVESRLLLNPIQQHSIWRRIVSGDDSVSALSSNDTLAELAASAYELLCLHNGRPRLREFNLSADTRAFQRWAESFDRTCARNGWIASAQLPAALSDLLAEGSLPLPDPGLLLVDFDALAPAHADLFDSIHRAGFDVDRHKTSAAARSANLYSAADDAREMRAAAVWAQRVLAENPAASIAVVVPDLAQRRGQLDRVFSEVLPGGLHEFSLGRPLAETALVATAFDLLRWPLEQLPLESASALLLSPFFAAADPAQAIAAAEFDAFELRDATPLSPELSLETMIRLVSHSRRSQRLSRLLKSLRMMLRTAASEQLLPPAPDAAGPAQSHAGWADAFRNLLEASGWTAASMAGSLTFQTRRRWESALDSLATLDFDGSEIPASVALEALRRIARQAIFAPESRNAPIQIVGPLEPGGVPFDALWFLSADDRSWPAAASPNPLIPWHIQRDLGIHGADPIRDGRLFQSITERLAQAAPTVVFSYARHADDGARRPSALLRTLNLTEIPEPPENPDTPLPLLTVADTEPLPQLPDGVTHGGARILELQAACSFRAFAEIRLHSTEPEARTPGLDPRHRGIHVHSIMQTFWTRIQSQQALRGLPRPERDAILDHCIEVAIQKVAAQARTPWEDAYLNVQRRRLRALLDPWLDFELTRPPFTVRLSEQESRGVRIGPLQLNLRADRVDDTAAGPLIIDYKTGSAAPADWLSDRPKAPQLPLYAVLAHAQNEPHEDLGGVAFALLRAGDGLALKGFAANAAVLTKSDKMAFATLAEQVEDWRRVLEELAFAFAENDPVADPKSYPKTCERCTQRILCRLDTLGLTAQEEDEAEVGDA